MSRLRSLARLRCDPAAGLLALTLMQAFACAHGGQSCPPLAEPASAPTGPAGLPPALGWADGTNLASPEPLALYGVQWFLLAGDSAAPVQVPPSLHPFTLGRWECALGAEKASDELRPEYARVARSRKLVCTHNTGLTMQTELSCGFRMPALPADGSPARARRETHVSLADAPALALACEPIAAPRLTLYGGTREVLAEVCLTGRAVAACEPAALAQ